MDAPACAPGVREAIGVERCGPALALGAADMKLLEHVSAFTVFPNDGIRIDPHTIRRVTSYDGALLEEAHPEVHDVVSPDVARTMTAMRGMAPATCPAAG